MFNSAGDARVGSGEGMGRRICWALILCVTVKKKIRKRRACDETTRLRSLQRTSVNVSILFATS